MTKREHEIARRDADILQDLADRAFLGAISHRSPSQYNTSSIPIDVHATLQRAADAARVRVAP